jgi:hypothetical protein
MQSGDVTIEIRIEHANLYLGGMLILSYTKSIRSIFHYSSITHLIDLLSPSLRPIFEIFKDSQSDSMDTGSSKDR